jgi:hypothetical protein
MPVERVYIGRSDVLTAVFPCLELVMADTLKLVAAAATFLSIFSAAWSARLWWRASRVPLPEPSKEPLPKGSIIMEGRDAIQEMHKSDRARELLERTLASARRSAELNAGGAKWAMITAALVAFSFFLTWLAVVFA